MSINEIQEQVIEEFAMFDDWMDRYNYLIELGTSLPILNPKDKTEVNLISGCQSKVWLKADYENETLNFSADSDAIIVKGIVALMVRVLSGHKAEEILNTELYFIDKIGLRENLSPTRSNGLLAMVKKMKLYALAYHTKHNA
jgi:cysteine desulfuration protein SufE